MVLHTIEPVYNADSRILILGTMPSPRSREEGFYYMHPQNRFWRVMSNVLGEDFSCGIEGRREIILRRGIALWDVLKSCDITGASDATIKNETPNDLGRIFAAADIRRVYTTGRTAERLFKKHFKRECTALYSPSAANCAISFERLCEDYRRILEDLK